MTRADLLALAVTLTLSATLSVAGALLGAGDPRPPITQPLNVTPISRLPTFSPANVEPRSTPIFFVPIANPEGWCWVCKDSHGCSGALILSSLCLTPTPGPASYHGF